MNFLLAIVPALTACFAAVTSIAFLAKSHALSGGDFFNLTLAFALFLAASTAATAAWKRKKLALWAWLVVLAIAIPILLGAARQQIQQPNIPFATEEEAQNRTGAELFLRPTEAEFDALVQRTKWTYLILFAVLLLQTGGFVTAHRKRALE